VVVLQDALHAERRERASRDAALQRAIDAISLTPGPKGDKGEQGKP